MFFTHYFPVCTRFANSELDDLSEIYAAGMGYFDVLL